MAYSIRAFFFCFIMAAVHFRLSSQAYLPVRGLPTLDSNYPKRTLAGVTLLDTPIIRAAEALARQNSDEFLYKHVMRSWLFGSLIIGHNETFRSTVDMEAHAVSVLLHDLGWTRTPGSPLVSEDKRFEVDGAIAAREFIKNHTQGKHWDEHRVQLVWDSIALHSQASIFNYKELEVMVAGNGIVSDFVGPTLGITKEEYDAVTAEFPRQDFQDGFNDTIIWLCQSKPKTTYDTWMQPWGENYVGNYSAKGNRLIDAPLYGFP